MQRLHGVSRLLLYDRASCPKQDVGIEYGGMAWSGLLQALPGLAALITAVAAVIGALASIRSGRALVTAKDEQLKAKDEQIALLERLTPARIVEHLEGYRRSFELMLERTHDELAEAELKLKDAIDSGVA